MIDINIYIRTSDGQLLNSGGGEIHLDEDLPSCYYMQKPRVKAWLRQEDGVTPVTDLGVGDGFQVSVDKDFLHASAPMARTVTGFTVDAAEGSVEFVLNAATTAWGDAIGASAHLGRSTLMEIQITPTGESDVKKVFQFTFVCRNLMDINALPAPEDIPDSYVEHSEMDAALALKWGFDTYAGAWAAGTYTLGQWVTHNGSSWGCSAESTTEEPSGSAVDWVCLASKGDAGAAGLDGVAGLDGADGVDGTGWSWQGAWDAEATYAEDDAVTYQGSTYVSLQGTNVGKVPNEEELYWLCVVSKGDAGTNGTNGTNGAAGADGADGEDGAAWHAQDYDPSVGDGTDGDFWVNIVSGEIFQKVAGAWVSKYTLPGTDKVDKVGTDDIEITDSSKRIIMKAATGERVAIQPVVSGGEASLLFTILVCLMFFFTLAPLSGATLAVVKDSSTNVVSGAVTFSGTTKLDDLVLASCSEKTVASGAITITESAHTVDGEGDAADDLATISGGSSNQILLLRPEHADRNITLKHGVGNIRTSDSADFTVPDDGFVLLFFDGANWRVLSSGAGVGGVSDYCSVSFTVPNEPDDDAQHFEVDIDDDPAFGSILVTWDSRDVGDGGDGQAYCKYFNGTAWAVWTSGNGVTAAYEGQRGMFFFPTSSIVRGKMYYIRIRFHDGTAWGDYAGEARTW